MYIETNNQKYYLVVRTDVNGDGKVDTADVVEVYVEMKKGLKGYGNDSDDTEFGY